MAIEGFAAKVLERPDGVRLHVVEAGTGPTVLLAHGYLLDHTLYATLAPLLVARGYRVLAFDQRGHGHSGVRPGDDADAMAADCAALIRYAADPATTLVAHSMGAFLALRACLTEPELFARSVRRMVLVGGNAGKVAEGSAQNRLQIPLLKSGLLRRLWSVRPVGHALVSQLFGAHPDPVLVEQTRQTLLGNDPHSTLAVLRAMAQDDLYPRLAEVPVETCVLCGTLDHTCPPWHSRRLGDEIPGARSQWVAGRGHMLPLEDPETVLAAIADSCPR